MKYLNALLRGEEFSPHTWEDEPTKTSKIAAASVSVGKNRETEPSESEVVTWLLFKLNAPQRIAPLIAEWVGTLDNPTGRDIDDLMAARWTLGVEAYVGEDNRLWWRLPSALSH